MHVRHACVQAALAIRRAAEWIIAAPGKAGSHQSGDFEMISLQQFLLFLPAAVILNIAPGPDMLYVVSRSVVQGRRAGMLSSLGVCSGALVHAMAAAFGLSAILAASAHAFAVVKGVGAIYLIYLGVKAIRDKGASLQIEAGGIPPLSNWQIYRQGVLVDILNPKVALFFLAFLPQFIDPAHGSTVSQFLTLGAIVILIALAWDAVLVNISGFITGALRANKRAAAWMNRVMGAIFIGLGLRLAGEKL